jgi:subtilisin family serine protease
VHRFSDSGGTGDDARCSCSRVERPTDPRRVHRGLPGHGRKPSRTDGAASDGARRRSSFRVRIRDQGLCGTHERSGCQNPPSWGLDRVDQHNLPLDDAFSYNASGAGVTAYIVDSGIRITHNDFTGRATGGFTSINDGNGTNDCFGHGTHVAGTVGGATFGVAKGVDLIAVRVLDCSGNGTVSGAIAGVDWITQQAQANNVLPAVANMSLGAPVSPALDQAVQTSINAGVVYAVSAGNDATSACNQSPSRLGPALTAAASDSQDRRPSFSNFGSCVDLFAPGVSITSASIGSNSATQVRSGTSMASPHVAGAAALYLERNSTASPAAVASALTNNATSGAIANPGSGTPNRLLYTSFIGGAPPPGGTAVVIVLDATTAAVEYQWTMQPGARYILDLRAPDGSQWQSRR